jgi:replicative DNA helicase
MITRRDDGASHQDPGLWSDSGRLCFDACVQNSLQSLSDVLTGADKQLLRDSLPQHRYGQQGFPALDAQLGGGLRAGELILLGGPQGLGKTTFALQLLRNVVVDGGVGLYFSFEHDAITMLERLVTLEAGENLGLDGIPLARVRSALQIEDSQLGRSDNAHVGYARGSGRRGRGQVVR